MGAEEKKRGRIKNQRNNKALIFMQFDLHLYDLHRYSSFMIAWFHGVSGRSIFSDFHPSAYCKGRSEQNLKMGEKMKRVEMNKMKNAKVKR